MEIGNWLLEIPFATANGSDSLKAHGFRYYFIPLIGVLLTFPSRYLFTIDLEEYLALDHSRPKFRQDFTCPALLKNN